MAIGNSAPLQLESTLAETRKRPMPYHTSYTEIHVPVWAKQSLPIKSKLATLGNGERITIKCPDVSLRLKANCAYVFKNALGECQLRLTIHIRENFIILWASGRSIAISKEIATQHGVYYALHRYAINKKRTPAQYHMAQTMLTGLSLLYTTSK